MILKSFEEKKINLTSQKIHLLYGENQGQKKDFIEKVFKKKFKNNIYNYYEEEIIGNEEIIFNHIKSKSFFDNNKLIIINRTSDKIKKVIEEILQNELNDINMVLISNVLEKKSKLRSFFEKEKNLVCIPFYKDTDQSLIYLVNEFCKEKKINLSRQIINLIIKRSMNDRQNLKNELSKIEAYSLSNKLISENDILKLTNLSENYSSSSLIDNCLIQNKKKIVEIINENNFSIDECIQIIRIYLIKSKRILSLLIETEKMKSIDLAINSHKPPIFWKDKEIVKKQLQLWTKNKITKLINRINSTELLIKKNSNNSIIILLDFIFSETENVSNNYS